MNALSYSIQQIIGMEISREILEFAFPADQYSITTLEERMVTKCIRPYILTDMNILGGMTMYVDLRDCEFLTSANFDTEYIVRVPKAITNNKSIISANYVMVNWNNRPWVKPCTPTVMLDGIKMLDAVDAPPMITSAKVEVVGENLIYIANMGSWRQAASIQVTIGNNANLENVQAPYFMHVKDLITVGLKRWIYNNTIVTLDKGYILKGHELGIVKDIIDGYNDLEETYKEKLRNWIAISKMNDTRFMHDYLNTLVGSN